jgi:hypothetical protein
LTSFFSFFAQIVRWISQQPARRSDNEQLRWSILTSGAPDSKEELRCREHDREREEAALRRERDLDWRRRSGRMTANRTIDRIRRKKNLIDPMVHINCVIIDSSPNHVCK